MQTVFPPEQDSIFGNTNYGVSNPNVPHIHPYPTRFHGPNYTVPGTANDSYRQTTYAVPPFVGMGNEPSPIFRPFMGAPLLDAAAGGALGYLASPKKGQDDRAAYAAMGALVSYLAGTAGLIGFGAFLAWKHGKAG